MENDLRFRYIENAVEKILAEIASLQRENECRKSECDLIIISNKNVRNDIEDLKGTVNTLDEIIDRNY